MSERPKRIVLKPLRYQTTSSSDEAPKRRRTLQNNANENIDQDIGELRTLLEEEHSSMDEPNNTNNSYNIYTPKTNTHTQNIPLHTHVPSYLSPQNSFSQSRTHTYPTHFPTSNHTVIDDIVHSSNTGINKFQEKYGTASDIGDSYQLPDERRRESEATCTERSFDESNNPILNERLDRFEAELKRINGLLQNILKCVQHLKSDNRRRAPTKPAILPISSLEEMDIFEDIDDDGYSEIVHYFEYIGGFTLKEAVNLCLKEALTDSLTPSFTWWGREGGPRPLYNTRLILAIYDAVCSNRYINNPTRSEFQAQMREALRTAKERWRSRARGPRSTHPVNPRPRDFWSDERQEEENRRIRDN